MGPCLRRRTHARTHAAGSRMSLKRPHPAFVSAMAFVHRELCDSSLVLGVVPAGKKVPPEPLAVGSPVAAGGPQREDHARIHPPSSRGRAPRPPVRAEPPGTHSRRGGFSGLGVCHRTTVNTFYRFPLLSGFSSCFLMASEPSPFSYAYGICSLKTLSKAPAPTCPEISGLMGNCLPREHTGKLAPRGR